MADIISWFDRYEKLNKAKKIYWGFVFDGTVYAFEPTKEELEKRLRITRGSHTHPGDKLMLQRLTIPTRYALIISGRAWVVCTESYLNKIREEYTFINNGIAFEQVLRLQNGLSPYKKGDKRGFWEGGDIIINSEEIQVKFEACSVTQLKTIEKIEKQMNIQEVI